MINNFTFYWCLAIGLLAFAMRIIIKWYRSIININLRASIKISVLNHKIRATLFSVVIGISSTFLFSVVIRGVTEIFNIVGEQGIESFDKILSLKSFLILWLLSCIISMESNILTDKLGLIKYPFFGFIYLSFAFIISIGLMKLDKLTFISSNTFWILSVILIFFLRYKFISKGI